MGGGGNMLKKKSIFQPRGRFNSKRWYDCNDFSFIISVGILFQTITPNKLSSCCLVRFENLKCCYCVLLFYVHGKHLCSCRDGQLT